MNKFNVGCGPWDFGKEWTHVDGGNFWHVDSHDIYLSEYKRESADLIYSSHLIQYFDRTEVVDLIGAWYKKLKLGGALILSVPDWHKLKELPLNYILGPLYGKMRMDDRWIYHKTAYDRNSLTELLINLGFVVVSDWSHIIDFNDCSRAKISLNLEAKK